MGLFSFIGKAVKAVAGTALGLIPGGGIVKTGLGLVGSLLQSKQPMAQTATKQSVATAYSIPTLRAQPRVPQIAVYKKPMAPGYSLPPAVLRASPVMPGGAVATSQGIMASGGGLPPATYGGRSGAKKKKKRSSSSRRSSRARSSSKRKTGGRKLKFGSPAWRKKYMKKKRR